jgi:hypothetical protein
MATGIKLAHEFDIAWIIALWKAIHGGDPVPFRIDERTIAQLAATSQHLGRAQIAGHARPLTLPQLQKQLHAVMGIGLTEEREAPKEGDALVVHVPGGSGSFHCFRFPDDSTICVERPGDPAPQ